MRLPGCGEAQPSRKLGFNELHAAQEGETAVHSCSPAPDSSSLRWGPGLGRGAQCSGPPLGKAKAASPRGATSQGLLALSAFSPWTLDPLLGLSLFQE